LCRVRRSAVPSLVDVSTALAAKQRTVRATFFASQTQKRFIIAFFLELCDKMLHAYEGSIELDGSFDDE
jgi:hypothetical protein